MLSISPPMKGAGCGNYYLKLAQEDYYTKAQEEPGRWCGEGGRLLELHGKVTARVLKHLLEGWSVDGRQAMVQNAGHKNRQRAWDMTFSAPKAVSLLWALAPPEVRREIEKAHHEAVVEALAYLEQSAGLTRRGPGGRIKEQAALIFATFLHTTSRAQDMQIHTHSLLLNLGLRADGTSGSLQSTEIFAQKMTAGAKYSRGLAARLEERLGLTIDPEAAGFHIRGVPKGLCEVFSKRSRSLRKLMEQRGQSGAIAAKIATLVTRARKRTVPRAELFATWKGVADTYGWSTAEAKQLLQSAHEHQAAGTPVEPTRTSEAAPEHGITPPPPAIGSQSADRPSNDLTPTKREANPQSPSAERTANRRSRDEQAAGQSANDRRAGADQSAGEGANTQSGQGTADTHDRANAGQHEREHSKQRHEEQASQRTQSAAQTQTQKVPAWRAAQDLPFIRIEYRLLFPKAPFWSPVKDLKAPVIVIGRPPQPRWAKVIWRQDLVLVHFRLQQRRLFRRAPKWSPLRDLSIPALRFAKVPEIPKEEAPHTWGSVVWEKGLGPLALRVQKRRLFSRAYRSTRAGRLELPALRLVRNEQQQQQHSH